MDHLKSHLRKIPGLARKMSWNLATIIGQIYLQTSLHHNSLRGHATLDAHTRIQAHDAGSTGRDGALVYAGYGGKTERAARKRKPDAASNRLLLEV